MSNPLGPTSVSLDDMEGEPTSAGPKLTDVKFEGEGVPQHLVGKSAADLLKMVQDTQEAIKISEDARLAAEARAAAAAVNVPAQPTPVETPAEPELSDEEINELHQQDPIKAIRYISERAQRIAEKNLESRLGSVVQGTAAQVEQSMRMKYKDEFELFGAEISQMAAKIPNAKMVLSNPDNWEILISTVRGNPQNVEKLIAKRMAVSGAAQKPDVTARNEQAENIGFSDTGATRRVQATHPSQLDPVQREIAEKMNMTPEEYIHWANAGTRLS